MRENLLPVIFLCCGTLLPVEHAVSSMNCELNSCPSQYTAEYLEAECNYCQVLDIESASKWLQNRFRSNDCTEFLFRNMYASPPEDTPIDPNWKPRITVYAPPENCEEEEEAPPVESEGPFLGDPGGDGYATEPENEEEETNITKEFFSPK